MAAYTGKTKVDRSNPFLDDEEDDFEMVNGNQIQRQMREEQQRSLDSTKRSLALIDDSHDLACKTAEELVYQGEQLNRIEKNLDVIHDDLAVANRHITSMKSIWGTIGNYFKRAPKPTASAQTNKEEPKQGLENITSAHAFEPSIPSYNDGLTSNQSTHAVSSSLSKDPYERQINENIDLLSRGLGRLKEDALILGNEIERQNDQLPRIAMKAENADIKIEKAQKNIRKILR